MRGALTWPSLAAAVSGWTGSHSNSPTHYPVTSRLFPGLFRILPEWIWSFGTQEHNRADGARVWRIRLVGAGGGGGGSVVSPPLTCLEGGYHSA